MIHHFQKNKFILNSQSARAQGNNSQTKKSQVVVNQTQSKSNHNTIETSSYTSKQTTNDLFKNSSNNYQTRNSNSNTDFLKVNKNLTSNNKVKIIDNPTLHNTPHSNNTNTNNINNNINMIINSGISGSNILHSGLNNNNNLISNVNNVNVNISNNFQDKLGNFIKKIPQKITIKQQNLNSSKAASNNNNNSVFKSSSTGNKVNYNTIEVGTNSTNTNTNNYSNSIDKLSDKKSLNMVKEMTNKLKNSMNFQ